MMGEPDLLLAVFVAIGAIVIAILALVCLKAFESLFGLEQLNRERIKALEVAVARLERRGEEGGAS